MCAIEFNFSGPRNMFPGGDWQRNLSAQSAPPLSIPPILINWQSMSLKEMETPFRLRTCRGGATQVPTNPFESSPRGHARQTSASRRHSRGGIYMRTAVLPICLARYGDPPPFPRGSLGWGATHISGRHRSNPPPTVDRRNGLRRNPSQPYVRWAGGRYIRRFSHLRVLLGSKGRSPTLRTNDELPAGRSAR